MVWHLFSSPRVKVQQVRNEPREGWGAKVTWPFKFEQGGIADIGHKWTQNAGNAGIHKQSVY